MGPFMVDARTMKLLSMLFLAFSLVVAGGRAVRHLWVERWRPRRGIGRCTCSEFGIDPHVPEQEAAQHFPAPFSAIRQASV